MQVWLLDPHQWLGDLGESFLWPFLGGNAGIGKATAVDLARRGARVILGCRNKARGESAVYDIRRKVSKLGSGFEANQIPRLGFLPLLLQESGNSEVILMILDLGNLNSVRAFAQTFLASEPRLDILINNAGGGTADPPQGQPLGPLPADPPAPEPSEALRPEPDRNCVLDFAFLWEDRLLDHLQASGKDVADSKIVRQQQTSQHCPRARVGQAAGRNQRHLLHGSSRIGSNRKCSLPSPLGSLAALDHQAIPPRLENWRPDHHLLRHRGGHREAERAVFRGLPAKSALATSPR
ncbi:Retinol dehydrogenase 14, partial [Ophiophagus hannah]